MIAHRSFKTGDCKLELKTKLDGCALASSCLYVFHDLE